MSGPAQKRNRVVALCGGVGGAKLALGLERILGKDLTLIVNTGDDFEHLGLAISPDIDTVLYTLSGLANRELGWGRGDESWNFMATLETLGGETWFRLGDRDLALHVERTRRLKSGETLTRIIGSIAQAFGIAAHVLPMSDDPVRTMVETSEGLLPFQRYFVEKRCAPRVDAVRFEGAGAAKPTAAVLEALGDCTAIIICPSNPYLSVDPILAVPGLRMAIGKAAAPVVAISPLIGGAAVKGPTAKIMAELDVPATSKAIARHYDGLIDGLIIDETDKADKDATGVPTHVTATLMKSDDDRERLARTAIDFAAEISARTP